MKNCKTKIILFFAAAIAAMVFSVYPAFASITDGTIDPNSEGYKYAWGENIGWVNFGTANGAVYVTDSGLSGYALSETVGWINLNNIENDGEGNLSGYAWGENIGWIKFNPTKGGVIINNSGEFTGSALGENIGWIIFDGDYTVKTDWRPRSARPACNNSSDDDGDGKTDYPADPGCSSLTDTDETDLGGGSLPSAAYSAPTAPASVIPGVVGKFKVEINSGAEYTSSNVVKLYFVGGADTTRMAISNRADFEGAGIETYIAAKEWVLEQGEGKKEVFVKFYNNWGIATEAVSDTIIADTTAPTMTITEKKEKYAEGESIILKGTTEVGAKVILHWAGKYGLVSADSQGNWQANLGTLKAGTYEIELTPKDGIGNKGEMVVIRVEIFSTEDKKSPQPFGTMEPTGAEGIESPQPSGTAAQKPGIIEKIINIFAPEEKVPEEIPEIIVIPEEAPEALEGKWELLGGNEENFVLQPLPNRLATLIDKFPDLKQTFAKVGVNKLSDIDKIQSAELILPGLTKTLGLPETTITAGKIAKGGIPLAQLTPEMKKEIPEEVVFAKTKDELIDYDIILTVSEKGEPEQKITAISGSELNLIVKPENKVKTVKGYVVLKTKKSAYESHPEQSVVTNDGILRELRMTEDLSFLQSSFFRGLEIFAKEYEEEIEQELVLIEFEYTDPDGDGIYTANVQMPVVSGDYEIITVMDYEDETLISKEIRLVTVIDPEGYVYTMTDGNETHLRSVKISLYWQNQQTGKFELWPAEEYSQNNPQITDNTGKYSFLVPEGTYYLEATAKGYQNFVSETFSLTTGNGVHENIELTPTNWWLKILNWNTILLIFVIGLLFFIIIVKKKIKINLT